MKNTKAKRAMRPRAHVPVTTSIRRAIEAVRKATTKAHRRVAATSDTDPIFAAIEAHRKANLEWAIKLEHHDDEHPECVAAGDREGETYSTFWRTLPTTIDGFVALFRYLQEPRWPKSSASPSQDAIYGDLRHRAIIQDAVSEGWHDHDGEGGVPVTKWAHLMELALRRIAATA
jgi:hypothetical protein